VLFRSSTLAQTRQFLLYRLLKIEQEQRPAVPQLPDLGGRDVKVTRTHPGWRQAQNLHTLRAQVSHHTLKVGVRDRDLSLVLVMAGLSATADKSQQDDKAQCVT
jgi:hypothetical protein